MVCRSILSVIPTPQQPTDVDHTEDSVATPTSNQDSSDIVPGGSLAAALTGSQGSFEGLVLSNRATHLQKQASHFIRSEILFPLGIALTELSLGHTLADLRKPVDADSNEAYMNFKTVSRLSDLVYSESGARYGDSVLKCLHWIEVRDARLENEKFQQAVFDSIVTPLHEDLRDFNGATRIQ